MYLLDTNHCSAVLNGNATVATKLTSLGEALVATCVIVQGELMYMVERSARKAENLLIVQRFLDDLDVYPIDIYAANVYGAMKAALVSGFGPQDKRKLRSFNWQSIGVSDNDLWIAALAVSKDLIIVSNDTDFQRIKQVYPLKLETWI